METIVVFNAGRSAAREGHERKAPSSIKYPVVSKYVPYHTVDANLDGFGQRTWLDGFDYETGAELPSTRALRRRP